MSLVCLRLGSAGFACRQVQPGLLAVSFYSGLLAVNFCWSGK